MNSAHYRQAMEILRQRRQDNAREEARRKEEVFTAHPDVGELCSKRHDMILNGIRSILNQGSGLPEDPEKTMEQYNMLIREKLTGYGYAPDYLAPVCTCPLCGDTGLAGEGVKETCSCVKVLMARMESAGPRHTFEDWDADFFPELPMPRHPQLTQRKYMRTLRKKAEQFADAYPEDGKINLLLYGPSGLGKTWLAGCVASRLRDRGLNVKETTAYQMIEALKRDYFNPEGVSETYLEADFLVIDDLGLEPLFDNITIEMILNVLNERIVHGKGTAVSTNLTLLELQKRYTERFLSRMTAPDMTLVMEFDGTDMRLYRKTDTEEKEESV